MNSIIYDDEIITAEDNKLNYYKQFTNRLDKKDCVKLALFCAKSVNPNIKETNLCIELVEKWLIDKKSVTREELNTAANSAYAAFYDNFDTYTGYAAYASSYAAASNSNSNSAYWINYWAAHAASNTNTIFINKYLQILLRKTKQFNDNKIIEEIVKTDVDKLELVDWNMITDIIVEEYDVIHKFKYSDIFSRRCLIELLRREYT